MNENERETKAQDFYDRYGAYPTRYWAEKLGDGDRIIAVDSGNATDNGIMYKSVSYEEYDLYKRTK